MARYGSKAIRGHGIPEAMERILVDQSRIPARVTFLKPVSAAIAIGTGGPFGAEGPIIATGGAGTDCSGTGCRPLGVVIDGQDGIRDLSVSAGGIGTIKNDVSVWVWGRNDSGETGVASTDAVNSTCTASTKCIGTPHQMPNVPPLK